ncbi:PPOX class F420-dependent oxidoreductase [Asanoa siamensis]|uniref:Major facilitator superfamily (MFS) profile domain-containing protein n=1 Tax=Asanoa siamensis TaxID=926357 RepID=A0ABQ4D333_9ACTN|nr:PPOX class F420-dependent oxidoreductase [Asanoa siamensis]GIF77919.1 hypothetical protein Asi02nite_74370 [Asanoa siamensis]
MNVPTQIARARYATVTTYRRDGTPVPTPVGLAADAGELFLLTQRTSGKVKRIRNNLTVTVTPCDMNGRIATDAPTVRGHARLLDRDETARVRRLMSRRYPISRLVFAVDLLLRRRDRRIGTAIRLRPIRSNRTGPHATRLRPRTRQSPSLVGVALHLVGSVDGRAGRDRGYTLAFGGLLLFGGRLADIAGRKRIFLIGLLGFAVASAIGGVAGNIGTLLTARALQGVFAALLAPAALGCSP